MGQRIVCYGASNTYGYDPRSFLGEQYPPQVRWTDQLMQLCPEREVWNLGENGREIPRRPWEFQALEKSLRRAAPVDALLVMLGDNDLLKMTPPRAEVVSQRMGAFLAWLQEGGGPWGASMRIVLTASPPMCRGAWVQEEALMEESRRLGEYYRTLAEQRGVAFANSGAWGVERTVDGVHFSPQGHRAFAQGMDRVLRSLNL